MSADVTPDAIQERRERQTRNRRRVWIGFGIVFGLLTVLIIIGSLIEAPDYEAAVPATTAAPDVAVTATAATTTVTPRVPQPIDDWGKDWAEDIEDRAEYSFSPVPLTRPPEPTTTTTAPPRDCAVYFSDDHEHSDHELGDYLWEVCLASGLPKPYITETEALAILSEVVPGVTFGRVADVCTQPRPDSQPCAYVYTDGLGGGAIGLDPEPDGYALLWLLHEIAHHLTPGGGHGPEYRCNALVLFGLYAPEIVPADVFTDLWTHGDCETHLS